MGWGTIRKATQEDWDRLDNTLGTFQQKYTTHPDDVLDAYWAIQHNKKTGWSMEEGFYNVYDCSYVHRDEVLVLASMLRKRIRRALKCSYADGIAYGYVGYHAD